MVMDKKKLASIIVLVVGIIMLVVGIVFLILKLNEGPAVPDGEYLVSVGNWRLEDGSNCAEEVTVEETATDENTEITNEEVTNCIGGSGVIWTFTEIGKGTLTTNNHLNDYDFVWALEDGRMIVQTEWLYELDDEYEYELDQSAGTLTLSDGENEYQFVAQTE